MINILKLNDKLYIMKILSLFGILILFCNCTSSKDPMTTDIIKVENITNLDAKLKEHKNKDVEVFMSNMGNKLVYSLTIYRNDNIKLHHYSAYVYSLNTYNNAEYEWVNDSTVTFNLINKFHSHETYTVSGYGGTTALITD